MDKVALVDARKINQLHVVLLAEKLLIAFHSFFAVNGCGWRPGSQGNPQCGVL